MRTIFTVTLWLLLSIYPSVAGGFNPAEPASSGYQLSFQDNFGDLSSIDVKATGKTGFKWYTKRFFGYSTTPASSLSVGSNGLTISTGKGGENYAIATAGPANNSQGYVGTVFSGGAYFEAKIALTSNAQANRDPTKGWPSFWSMAVEHMALKGNDQFTGQVSGYEHFIENDFFEYLNLIFNHGDAGSYSAAVHDTYGLYNVTCPGFCSVQNLNPYVETPNGANTIWSRWHTIGQLWIPAGSKNNEVGYIQNYFDNIPISKTTWGKNQYTSGPYPLGSSAFSIIDSQHLVLIIGTGVNQPFNIEYVRVWSPGPGALTTNKMLIAKSVR